LESIGVEVEMVKRRRFHLLNAEVVGPLLMADDAAVPRARTDALGAGWSLSR
jgi:hypothetical protein